jgi:2-amino-4-hydroxy-6-hydroxymethyldihydropteridine diphosphokinase
MDDRDTGAQETEAHAKKAQAIEVYISAGSNINPVENLRFACQELERLFGVLVMSSVYRSPAFGFNGDDFLNMAVSFKTDLGWQEVVSELSQVERAAGRERKDLKYSSRKLDLDLLLYGDLVVDQPDVRLPRNDLIDFAFVLRPMAEIAPDLQHPESGTTLQVLWDEFSADDQPTEKLTGIYQPMLRPPSTAIT